MASLTPLLPLLLLLLYMISLPLISSFSPQFEGFGDDEDEDAFDIDDPSDLPISSTPPPTITLSAKESDDSDAPRKTQQKEPTNPLEFWDEDEFEGIPTTETQQIETPEPSAAGAGSLNSTTEPSGSNSASKPSYLTEIVSVAFLVAFAANYFLGKKENEEIALAWAAEFATKDKIFERNFSLLGTGDGKEDAPLLLKEGQNVFKFYASGRRFCQSLLATMELKNRHDLMSRLYGLVIPTKDEITVEVFMNEEAMDHVIFAVARKKMAKGMHKESKDLARFGSLVGGPPQSNRKWLTEELGVVSESKEVAGELMNEVVLEQVFGEKPFEKFGKNFISLHFSDQYPGGHRKRLVFKFALPSSKKMSDMTRLIALVPYYIDLIGRYKLSAQARSKTEAARTKLAQEIFKELQSVRQEALQKKKADRQKMMQDDKTGSEANHKKDEKDRARQLKKSMPRVKISRAR